MSQKFSKMQETLEYLQAVERTGKEFAQAMEFEKGQKEILERTTEKLHRQIDDLIDDLQEQRRLTVRWRAATIILCTLAVILGLALIALAFDC